jgi:predicted nucleotidyltransferase/DNA-binding XRE family transcriptional regulator
MRSATLIRDARRRARLTQAALALRAGTSQPTLAHYERGGRQPRADTLDRILRCCGFEIGLVPVRPAAGRQRALLDEHRDQLLALLRHYGARNARLFGSVARGDATSDSDIDILVDLPGPRRLLRLAGLTEDLRELLGDAAGVDVATTDTLRPEMRAAALAEAVPL